MAQDNQDNNLAVCTTTFSDKLGSQSIPSVSRRYSELIEANVNWNDLKIYSLFERNLKKTHFIKVNFNFNVERYF